MQRPLRLGPSSLSSRNTRLYKQLLSLPLLGFSLERVVPSPLAMFVAIPTLEDRVSPVFDVAQAVVIAEIEDNREQRRQTVPLYSRDLTRRAAELAQHGVNVLICGAISLPLEAVLDAAGVRVIPQTCGGVNEVLRAFVAGRLDDGAFLIPGCCGRRRRGWCGAGGSRRVRRGQAGGRGGHRRQGTGG